MEPIGIVNGLQMVYIKTLSMHQKRLTKPMRKLMKPLAGVTHVHVVVILDGGGTTQGLTNAGDASAPASSGNSKCCSVRVRLIEVICSYTIRAFFPCNCVISKWYDVQCPHLISNGSP